MQKSTYRCVYNESFGCLSADTMYVRGCHGEFNCTGSRVECGSIKRSSSRCSCVSEAKLAAKREAKLAAKRLSHPHSGHKKEFDSLPVVGEVNASSWHQLTGTTSHELVPGRRYVPRSEAEYAASVLTFWGVLDTIVSEQNFGCVDKSPLSHPNTSMCTGRSDRFNPYAFGYMRPVQMLAHMRHIRRLASARTDGTVTSHLTYCEVGMNGGHGVAAALLADPHMVAHSFDLLEWRYSLAVVRLLQAHFPGRFHSHAGNSFDTLPRWSALPSSPRCDVMLIDGLHSAEATRLDALNFRAAAACGPHVAFFDDIQVVGVVIRRLVSERLLQVEEEHMFAGGSDEACLRLYKKRTHGMLRLQYMPHELVDQHYHLQYVCPTGEAGWGFAITRFVGAPCGATTSHGTTSL